LSARHLFFCIVRYQPALRGSSQQTCADTPVCPCKKACAGLLVAFVRLKPHKRMLWLYLKSFCVVSKGASSLASPLPAVCKEWCLLHSHCKVLNSPCKDSFCQHAPMPTPTLCSSTHACSVRLSLRMQLEQVWSCQ